MATPKGKSRKKKKKMVSTDVSHINMIINDEKKKKNFLLGMKQPSAAGVKIRFQGKEA